MKPAQGRFSRRRDASSEAVQTTAADWLARRDEGLTADEQAQFSEWLLADARHVAAVREIEAAWRFMQKPRFTGQADLVCRPSNSAHAAGPSSNAGPFSPAVSQPPPRWPSR